MTMERITINKRLYFFDNLKSNLLLFNKRYMLLIMCILLTATVRASGVTQQNMVSGKVTDATNGQPLVGVSVVAKGTTLGLTTNIDGEFSFTIPDRQHVLVFSYIGYIPQEIMAVAGKPLRVELKEDVMELEQVVVVGYGVQRKESVIGAISQIGTESLTMAGTNNISNAIAGKLSGVLTIQNTGEPGANHSEIIIRGLSSWSGSAPLVMVDGVERDFRFLDPNEIETISVLKDA